MEEFDYIDKLAKSELSGRTMNPSTDGWNVVQQKMKRQKRKRFLIYFLILALLGTLVTYMTINNFSDDNHDPIVNKNTEQLKSDQNKKSNNTNSTSTSDSTLDDASQAGTNSLGTNAVTTSQDQLTTTYNNREDKNRNTENATQSNSPFNTTNTATSGKLSNAEAAQQKEVQYNTNAELTYTDVDGKEDYFIDAAGVKLYPWELISPETLKRERKKRKPTTKEKVYEKMDLMIGFNGFTQPNNYNFIGSYVVEISYTEEKKLKNNYYFNYGASVQFRNLRYKKDSVSFNRGELSLNLLSSVEKRFGNFGVEAGLYAGYEFYSPNNELFNNAKANFFEQKINYGLSTTLNYKQIGLIFKYELSPYINYLGDKKFGAFTIGVKYDF